MRMEQAQATSSPNVWAVLITRLEYLPGVLTLDYSLKRAGSVYPLVALYTDAFPASGRAALTARAIPIQRVPYVSPGHAKDYRNDPRFNDCWTKLAAFGLVEYERIVMLDADMLVLQNMDELMELELDAPELGGDGRRVFAASHACACNPLKKAHYPKDWIPAHCAFTALHADPDTAQTRGAPATAGISMPNSGLVVFRPSSGMYAQILRGITSPRAAEYDFADQELLGDIFRARWVPLPYVYNALKFFRWEGVHSAIWRDARVKNMHYGLNPKPWEETAEQRTNRDVHTESNDWWWDVNDQRIQSEKELGYADGW